MRIIRMHLIPSPEAQAAGQISFGVQCNNTALGNFAKMSMFISHVGEMLPCADFWVLSGLLKALGKVMEKIEAKCRPGVYSGGVVAWSEFAYKVEIEVDS